LLKLPAAYNVNFSNLPKGINTVAFGTVVNGYHTQRQLRFKTLGEFKKKLRRYLSSIPFTRRDPLTKVRFNL
jgi:hypothetical protein